MKKEIKLTWEQWEDAKVEADRRMKENNGHFYEIILKTRCIHCRRSPRDKRRCGSWFQTYITHLDTILLNLTPAKTSGKQRGDNKL